MNEHVSAENVGLHEAVALIGVEPFYGAGFPRRGDRRLIEIVSHLLVEPCGHHCGCCFPWFKKRCEERRLEASVPRVSPPRWIKAGKVVHGLNFACHSRAKAWTLTVSDMSVGPFSWLSFWPTI